MKEATKVAGTSALIAIALACSSGSSTGAGQGGTSGGGAAGSGAVGQGAWSGKNVPSGGSVYLACMPDDPCTLCVIQNCSSQAIECFGTRWQQQQYGAACGPFSTCMCACEPDSNPCQQACVGELNGCLDCTAGAFDGCILQKCMPICCERAGVSSCGDSGA